eukprot:1130155-Amphidinium_carterae.1
MPGYRHNVKDDSLHLKHEGKCLGQDCWRPVLWLVLVASFLNFGSRRVGSAHRACPCSDAGPRLRAAPVALSLGLP